MMRTTKQWERLLQTSALLLSFWLLNIGATKWHFELDLTENKQFTLSEPTKNILKNLDELLYIEVYLEGDLNADFKRLQKNIRSKLESFKSLAPQYIDYQFINPENNLGPKARRRFYQQLVARGLQPTNLYDNQNGKKIQKLIFPGAIVNYGGAEAPVLFLKGRKTTSPQEQLNQSIEGLEYELINVIYQLTIKEKKHLAFTTGHGELETHDLESFIQHAQQFYKISFEPIDRHIFNYDAVIMAQPKQLIPEHEKFWLDQYLMAGGKILVLLDNIRVNLDSIAQTEILGLNYELNLGDLLFKYGLKINSNLLQDQQAGFIQVVAGNYGNRPNIQKVPWPYYIYLNTFSKHIITKNLNVIYSRFVSSIDTVSTPQLLKIPLVFSSAHTRIKAMPNIIGLNELREDLKPERYKYKHLPVAYLVEGQFQSAFAAYFRPPQGLNHSIVKKSHPDAKLVVFADGEIIKNEINPKTGQALALDLDPSTQQPISNLSFLMNTLAYMTDKEGIIVARKNEIILRPLDKFKINTERTEWQVFNIALPLGLVLLFGLLRWYWRRKQYAR